MPHPFSDRDDVHEVYRSWRRIAESYPEPRALIGEVWLPDDPDRFALYLRPDELHTAFNFDFLGCPWDASAMRTVVDDGIALHAPVGAPATWVLSNHDVIRHVTRYGRADTRFSLDYRQFGAPTDLALGTRRARAAVLLLLALPGSGVHLPGRGTGPVRGRGHPRRAAAGPDVLPDQRRQPRPRRLPGAAAVVGRRSRRSGSAPTTRPARRGCRSPSRGATSPSPAQQADPDSMLELYRQALHLRRDVKPASATGR